MTDITELATVLRLAAESEIAYRAEGDTSDLWQDEASPDNVLALVEALEKAQTKAVEQGRTACELFDEVTALRQRIASLEESHAQVIQSRDHYKHMSEEGLKKLAESRTVTVKLPQRQEPTSSGHYGDGYLVPSNAGSALNYEDTIEALTAAGIKWEAE
ncbi:ead/Ea22-like family protein [Klebsiella aerogenes]|uniref:hypothetical protein n=1 Tax=Klebsiella aerogenes TaxID=548 RepID=UPI000F4DC17B|nr:hypothetical protein [Klebsiella aerogenes]AYY00655.1 hypothetical protein EGY11_11250 [Klebsiella aerogenes]DAO36794.1 MAG TPA: Ead/Ea22-like protein [Caudoviricetes sp.]